MPARVIIKHKHDDWKAKLEAIGKPQEIISLLMDPEGTRKRVTNLNSGLSGQVENYLVELLGYEARYTDYHGIGILDTDLFMVIVETFPPRTEVFRWSNKKEEK
jgi:hypothetical protein